MHYLQLKSFYFIFSPRWLPKTNIDDYAEWNCFYKDHSHCFRLYIGQKKAIFEEKIAATMGTHIAAT